MKVLSIVLASMVVTTVGTSAQWLKHPTPGIPRTADGKPDLHGAGAATPGRQTGFVRPPADPGELHRRHHQDLKAGEVAFQPWAEQLYTQRRATESKDDPTGKCNT